MNQKLQQKYLRQIGEKVYNFFFENPNLNDKFEFREGQAEMACEIVDAISDNKNLVVEAGVGIGKSYAYLVPLLYYNLYFKQPVAIATSTIALQEQLKGDISFIMKELDIQPEVLLAKGMNNFLCKYRFKEYFYREENLKKYGSIYEVIDKGGYEPADWQTKISEMPNEVWKNIRIDNYNYRECRYCEYRDVCHYHLLRQKLRKTCGIIICNQDMLTMDLRLKREMTDGLFTDELSLLVIDEAHNLENKVRASYTDSLTKMQILSAVRDCYRKIKRVPPSLSININKLFIAIDKAFATINTQIQKQIIAARKQHQDADRFHIHLPQKLLQQICDINNELMVAHAVSIRRTGGTASERIEKVIDFFTNWQNTDEYIIWAENGNNPTLYLCPKHVNKKIDDLFFGSKHKLRQNFITVFTSATLTNTANEDLNTAYSYFIQNTDLPLTSSILSEPKPSPFNYDAHSLLFYSDTLPNPAKNRLEFIKQSISLLVELLNISHGKALILFTSKSDMHTVYRELQKENLPYTLIKQNEVASQKQTLQNFKHNVNSVLLGTGSFWEGISIEGIALSNLIIYKLPFPVPEPIINEKCAVSDNPLDEVLVPEMIIKLKQGVGRLIRNKTDKGIISIIDPRLSESYKATYSPKVWNALPIKNKTTDINTLRNFYRSVVSNKLK